ncbi:MAG: GNAT family N-acetyltransferase [Ferruginibacter sp.]
MNKINIECYQNAYKDEVAALILSIQQDEFDIPVTLDMQPDLEEISSFYQINNGNFWVARSNNKIIGTIALLDLGNNKAALRKMFVAKEYRGKEFGAGQLLLDNLTAWATQNSFSEIFLGTTQKFVAAHRFYEKNNFIEISKKDLPPVFPVMDVDVKFYKFSI